jgi:peptidylprolyl isomerase
LIAIVVYGFMQVVVVKGTGDGQPKLGSFCKVHYIGKLASDGSIFDSSRDREGLFEFKLGEKVIQGHLRGGAGLQSI